ncbi:MAG: DHH family phosphoesterase [Thaumarchaeota archaeon]|nr:MAG: DHH family phosphoesterase [Nitrososphaerota archaeon]
MANFDELLNRYNELSQNLTDSIREGKKFIVVTHIDADGLCSGAMTFVALARRGATVSVRTVPDLDPKTIESLREERYDFYIFTDLASTLVDELKSALDNRFLVLDHHELREASARNPALINAWQYGYDGGTEACSSTMAYYFARALDYSNRDLAHLSVIGAVADRQDVGEGRSLTGLNRKALEEAQSSGLLLVSKDLLFYGRETRPLHEAIATSSSPFIKGLSGSKDAALAALVKAGVRMKESAKWRTLAELSSEEKKKVTEVVASFLAPAGGGGAEVIGALIGDVYTLAMEDAFTPLRDAREFATLLNSCGRMERPGLGLSICVGDRGEPLREGMSLLTEYRAEINKSVQGILSDPGRVEIREDFAFVTGDDLVNEKLLGPVTSILASAPQFKDRVIVARTKSGDSELKISSRVGDSHNGEVDLGVMMREAAEKTGGVGGGHMMAAGAKIPLSRGQEFTKTLVEGSGV